MVKHISTATDTDATVQEAVFCVRSFAATVQQQRINTQQYRNIAGSIFCMVRFETK
jgi:hypothetical protein